MESRHWPLVCGLIAVVATYASSVADEAIYMPCNVSVVVFQGPSTKEVFQDKLEIAAFKKWFLEDYFVGGERIETPNEASVFGALIVSHDKGIVVMPLNSWTVEKTTFFACQSPEIGSRPRFSVLEDSREAFLSRLLSLT